MLKKYSIIILVAVAMAIGAGYNIVNAEKLVWAPSSGVVEGYILCYGTSPKNYSTNKDVGKVTECSLDTLPLAENVQYHFAVKAYNTAGESSLSNEITWSPKDTTPPAPPKGLITN